MPVIDTGKILDDAVQNMVAALMANRVAWGLRDVLGHPATPTSTHGDTLCVLPDGWQPLFVQGSYASVDVDHKVPLRIWFFAQDFSAHVYFRRAYQVLSDVGVFLIENPRPNGYGNVALDESFGPQLGLLPLDLEQQLYGVNLRVSLTITKLHTVTQ